MLFPGSAAEAASGPSALILTRGTLEEEEEAVESDTDDVDHQGEEGGVACGILVAFGKAV